MLYDIKSFIHCCFEFQKDEFAIGDYGLLTACKKMIEVGFPYFVVVTLFICKFKP